MFIFKLIFSIVYNTAIFGGYYSCQQGRWTGGMLGYSSVLSLSARSQRWLVSSERMKIYSIDLYGAESREAKANESNGKSTIMKLYSRALRVALE